MNLERHLDNIREGLRHPVRRLDQPLPLRHRGGGRPASRRASRKLGVPVVMATHWADGGKGAAELAQDRGRTVRAAVQARASSTRTPTPLWDKIKTIATKVYGASEVTADAKVRGQIKKLQEDGYGHYPVCVAKTQYSFSTDADAARRADRPRGQRPRGAARRRRGVRRHGLRRHHDHAGAAEGALGDQDRPATTARSSACSRA